MKRQMLVIVLVVISILFSGCGPAAAPVVETAVPSGAEFALQSTGTALAAAQAAFEAQQKAVEPSATTPPPVDTPQPQPTAAPVEPQATGKSVDSEWPFYIYADFDSPLNHYTPAGYMGDIADIFFDGNFQRDPDPERQVVIQIKYARSGSNGWSGIYWWDPANSQFGEVDGGFDLSRATKLTFLARGENGGEKGEFKVGGIKGNGFMDSLQPAATTGPIVLTKEWTSYTLDLTGKDLTHIIGGFVWVTSEADNLTPTTIYLDEIRFE